MTAKKPGPPPKIIDPDKVETEPAEAEPVAQETPSEEPWWHLHPHRMSLEARAEIFSELYSEGKEQLAYFRRFTVMLSLSIVIAVLGITNDSAPVVIGAMLISPLTTPLLGLSASLILGWPKRQLETLGVLIVATVGGVGLAYLSLYLIPDPQGQTLLSSELLSRTQPRVLDLAVAVAAGAAGAYVLTRRQALSALPGVAIAVALVPPLSVVGMALELGRTDLAENAFLLYLVNLAGIVLSGSVVLFAMGMFPQPDKGGKFPRRTRIGLIAAASVVLAVAYPLSSLTSRAINEDKDRRDAEKLVDKWVGDSQLEVTTVELDGSRVEIDVAGPTRPPGSAQLTQRLANELEQRVEVKINWTLRSRIETEADPG